MGATSAEIEEQRAVQFVGCASAAIGICRLDGLTTEGDHWYGGAGVVGAGLQLGPM